MRRLTGLGLYITFVLSIACSTKGVTYQALRIVDTIRSIVSTINSIAVPIRPIKIKIIGVKTMVTKIICRMRYNTSLGAYITLLFPIAYTTKGITSLAPLIAYAI